MAHGLRTSLGFALVGYGLLVLLRVLAHDALLAGVSSLVVGAFLLFPALPSPRASWAARYPKGRRWIVAGVGAVAAGGVIVYNAVFSSSLILPEVGILVYGLLLMAASQRLDVRLGRTDVGTLVGWSFPVLLTPLLLFALNAVLSGPAGVSAEGAAGPAIVYGLVLPLAFVLRLIGTPAEVIGDNLVLETSRGSLSLGIGLVCAGLYPMVLFLGILALHAWEEGLAPRRFASYLGLGLGGLWVTNIVRMTILAKVGERWGGVRLQEAHAHLGWILFAVFMLLFWVVVVRRIERGRSGPGSRRDRVSS